MSAKACIRCGVTFEPSPSALAMLAKRGKGEEHARVCPSCVLQAIDDMYCEAVMHMSEEELRAELEADGVDVDAFLARTHAAIAEMLKARKRGSE